MLILTFHIRGRSMAAENRIGTHEADLKRLEVIGRW